MFSTPARVHAAVSRKLQGLPLPILEQLGREICLAVRKLPDYRWWRTLGRSVRFDKLIPAERRRENWQALSDSLGCVLPELLVRSGEIDPRFPDECNEILGLAWWIADHYPDRVAWTDRERIEPPPEKHSEWTEERVWQGVRADIADALGVDVEKVTPHVSMVSDLGME